MIIREWRGRARREKTEEYRHYFRRHVVPEFHRQPGFLGASLSMHAHGDGVEFLVLTQWLSMEAVRGFAGEEPEKAVVEPGAIALLMDYDRTVRHYDVLDIVSSG